MINFQDKVSFIWSIAEILRDRINQRTMVKSSYH